MSDAPPIGALYRSAQQSFVALAGELTPQEWGTPVPCCPAWTVRDVLSHVAGLADDVLAGRTEGAGTEPWTAAQVERWRDAPVAELIARWDAQAARVGALLERFDQPLPPVDCWSHEQDVRHALGRPGERDGDVIRFATGALGRVDSPIPVTVELNDGRRLAHLSADAGQEHHDPCVVRGLDGFELLRSRLGRRSASQVRAYDWSAPPPGEVLDTWFIFGPSHTDIVE